jgi:GGDEF domain-containing protein
MFISLRKYLENRPEQMMGALHRMVRLLLEAIDVHAIRGDSADYEKFRKDVASILESLAATPTACEVLVLAGKTVKSLEEYNSRTGKVVEQQRAELQATIAMLTKAMAAVAAGSQTTVGRLEEIERELETASQLEDFQSAKARMAECLHGLRAEIGRQKIESTHQVTELRAVIEKSSDPGASWTKGEVARTDPITGLLERPAAEAALAAAVKQGQAVYAAVFVLERLDLVNSRFGREVGDQVLAFFHEHVARSLTERDRLFRWTGPALIVVVERDVPMHKVREEMSRIVSSRLSKSVMIAGRPVLLAVPSNWMVFAAHEVRRLQQLLQNIDAFVEGNSRGAATPSGSSSKAGPKLVGQRVG